MFARLNYKIKNMCPDNLQVPIMTPDYRHRNMCRGQSLRGLVVYKNTPKINEKF